MRHMLFPQLSALLLALSASQAAMAHAIVIKSSPAVDAVITGEDVPIRLQFNSRIDHDRSRLTLFAPTGAQQPLTPTTDAPPDALTAAAAHLAPGVWRLRWQVLSVDGHITRGDIPFTVR